MEPLMIKIIIALKLRTVVLRLTSVWLKVILIMSVSYDYVPCPTKVHKSNYV